MSVFQFIFKLKTIYFEILTGAFIFISVLLIAYYRALYFDGDFADGPFQLLNALRRLNDGQTLGKDFNFFHGIGTLYIHYPLFVVFGKNLFASEFSRQLVSHLLFIIVNYLFLYIFSRSRKIAFIGSLLGLLFSNSYKAVFDPINSMLGVRSFMVFILAGYLLTYFIKMRDTKNSIRNCVIIGFLLAISIFISTESGLAVILAFYTSYLFIYREPFWQKVRFTLYTTGILFISAFEVYYYICGEYWIECLKFLFLEVPADQFWYFGVYPVSFATSISQLFTDKRFSVIFVVSVCMLIYFYREYTKDSRVEKYALIVLILYGIFSTIPLLAIYNPNYYAAPLARIIYLVLILMMCKKFINKLSDKYFNMFTIGVLIFFVLFGVREYHKIIREPEILYTYNNAAGEWISQEIPYYSQKKYLGVYLSKTWERHLINVEAILNVSNDDSISLWSTYTSVIEADYNIYNPYIDYIIHGLGPIKRTQYVQNFKKISPEFVRTDNEKVWTFGEWLRNEHWEVYKELFSHYSIAYIDEKGVLWQKNNQATESMDVNKYYMNFKQNQSYVFDDVKVKDYKPEGIYSIKVKYKIDNPYSFIPYINRLPRYFVYVENSYTKVPISLAPYQTEFTFPILPLLNGSSPILTFEVKSLIPGCKISVNEVSIEKIVLPEKTLEYLYYDIAPRIN